MSVTRKRLSGGQGVRRLSAPSIIKWRMAGQPAEKHAQSNITLIRMQAMCQCCGAFSSLCAQSSSAPGDPELLFAPRPELLCAPVRIPDGN